MESLGVISKIDEPTEWCSPMVVVPKPNGTVRICVDLTKLNESVQRERLLLPSVEQTLAQISGAKYFSKLDANSGFWQIQLAPESSKLTTFITPFGRFAFNRLPFGITSAPEYFQRKMSEILSGLEGVVCLIDDVLIYGNTEEQHHQRLKAALTKISKAGLTLNKEKCIFGVTKISFLGQSVGSDGIKPDPRKLQAIQEIKQPSNVTELRRFLGMINQLSKFSPHLANKTQPLRLLLTSKNHWLWGTDQEQAFTKLKESLTSTEVLAMYDPNLDTVVSADASAYGLGAVLRQKQPNGDLRPVAYISRALNSTELKYAQIEKEALAATWACERFQDYLLGKHFKLETDHKPLVPLLSSKSLDEMPIRIQRFRLRLMRFSYEIYHVPGKLICTADTLSRAPVAEPDKGDKELQTEVNAFVDIVLENLPATAGKLKEIESLQDEDPVCQQIKMFCEKGWPKLKNLTGPIKQYLPCKSELTVNNGILLRGSRLVIPPALRPEIIEKLHAGHQGFIKCERRAQESVWWPRIRQDIDMKVSKCIVCSMYRSQKAEPLMPTTFPDRPWQKVGTDIFEWKKCSYLLVIDYYSRYIEVAKLTSTTSRSVVQHLKSIFSHHGIPDTVMSDNGPQFSSSLFQSFSKEYGFTHSTSSPKYPQANGAAERAVQTVKSLLNKNEDPYLAMLCYRATPLENGFSPAELLMGRKIRTTVPVLPNTLDPKHPNNFRLRKKEKAIRERQRRNFNSRHHTKELQPLKKGERVWIRGSDEQAVVTEELPNRSYVVQTPHNTYRRNRRDLIVVPNSEFTCAGNSSLTSTEDNTEQPQSNDNNNVVQTRSGRVSKPPNRLIED